MTDLRAADAAELARRGAELALGSMRQLLTAAMPPATRGWLDHLWDQLAERAVGSVTVSAPAVSVVDERTHETTTPRD